MKKLLFFPILTMIFFSTSCQAQTSYIDTKPIYITNDSLTITGSEGYHAVYITASASNTTNGIYRTLATGTIGGKAITSIYIEPGKSINLPLNDKWYRNIRIVAPSGCTISIIGLKYAK